MDGTQYGVLRTCCTCSHVRFHAVGYLALDKAANQVIAEMFGWHSLAIHRKLLWVLDGMGEQDPPKHYFMFLPVFYIHLFPGTLSPGI